MSEENTSVDPSTLSVEPLLLYLDTKLELLETFSLRMRLLITAFSVKDFLLLRTLSREEAR